MLSSLSNLLPSTLSTLNRAPTPTPTPVPTSVIRADADQVDDADGAEVKSEVKVEDPGASKQRKIKYPNETFIFVRPPPAKNNHPLNLQVQLVPPNTRAPSGLTSASRQSLDLGQPPSSSPINVPVSAGATSQYDAGMPLSRSPSNRSIASSTYSSVSTSSVSSSISSRRMIVPLYSLQAHNVMTNTIVDAGTDAKIARFGRRGIEMLDLAMLEPIEVYGGELGVAPSRNIGKRSSVMSNASNGLLSPPLQRSRPATPEHPASSQASLVSSSAHSFSIPEPPSDNPPTPTPQKRFGLGKLFKRKEDGEDGPITPTKSKSRFGTGLLRSPAVSSSTNALPVASPRTSMSSNQEMPSENIPAPQPTQATARALILGVLPTQSSPVHPPKGRPGLYVWVVRKWLKSDGTGLLSVAKGMVKGFEPGITNDVEVRFEWKRGKPRRRAKDSKAGTDEANSQRERSNKGPPGSPASKRLSLTALSRQSSSSLNPASEDSSAVKNDRRRSLVLHQDDQRDDSGDESDPEDSEVPWTCTVKVRRIGPHPGPREPHPRDPSGENAEVLRIKVGTMSPTPHHPKVVGMLKVPFPLPDVDVEHIAVRKRESGQGPLGTTQKPGHGLILTAEEIKDVICSTGLWLVVRENFGGVGKVSRKGDGWRIRG
ncbi:unnamed protein product [Mycena citricolor]|uniref:Uncharacterized protein n=1 Tax=Mycena citricolor TaxID=2018698 RepID=A0AAD2H8K0_9AGAR|nr:unnamed protein product [Mycena citricolor]